MKEPASPAWISSLNIIRSRLDRFKDLGPLLVRVSLGVLFAQSGLGKLSNLPRTTEFFESLGIPAPEIQALVVGNVELLGGVALALGLLTRLAALPLAATMLVAIVTALLPEVENVLDLLALNETLYLAVLVLLVTQGPGRWSVDAFVESRFAKRKSSAKAQDELEKRKSTGEATVPLHPQNG